MKLKKTGGDQESQAPPAQSVQDAPGPLVVAVPAASLLLGHKAFRFHTPRQYKAPDGHPRSCEYCQGLRKGNAYRWRVLLPSSTCWWLKHWAENAGVSCISHLLLVYSMCQ